MTFKEFYQREKQKPTPTRVFFAQIAELCGVTELTISKWISGYQRPDRFSATMLEKHFNTTIDELFPPKN